MSWTARIERKLDAAIAIGTEILNRLTHLEKKTMKEFDELEAQVKATTDVELSAVALINGIASQLAALIGARDPDLPTKLQDLTTRLQVSASALAQAIVANTPAAAPPTPAPTPAPDPTPAPTAPPTS